jgi:O-antigen ligase
VRKIVLPTLFIYLTILAVAQTVYGGAFMTSRWPALALVLLAAGVCWFSTRPLQCSRSSTRSTVIVLVYLGMTFLSVVTAENPLFSGLKWVSHAAMIVLFLIFLLQSVTLQQASQALNILKVLVALLILLSWLKPEPRIGYGEFDEIELFRGAFGSPNSMGQVAAVGCLLFLHSFLTSKKRRWLRRAEIIIACVAAWLVWSSGARSALVAALAGLLLMNYFYPGKLRGRVLWVALLAGGLALAVPDIPKAVSHFILRGSSQTKTFSEQIFTTRASVWTAAWEGFKKRPLFGWGFGADDGISKVWEPKLTALGIVSRDSVNDTLIVLESTGVIGLIAYILLVILSMKQIPTRRERFLLRKIHAPPSVSGDAGSSAYHNHAIAFIIAGTLLVTVQFDNTALSAGNFVSVTLWLCVALAGAIKSKVVAYELATSQHQDLLKRLYSQQRNESLVSASMVNY